MIAQLISQLFTRVSKYVLTSMDDDIGCEKMTRGVPNELDVELPRFLVRDIGCLLELLPISFASLPIVVLHVQLGRTLPSDIGVDIAPYILIVVAQEYNDMFTAGI